VAVPHGRIEESWQETDCVYYQRVAFPVPDGVPRAGRFDVGRVILHVHINRALQAELAVFEHDRVFILRDSINWPVEVPIEDDARGLAAESRVVFALEL